MALFYGPFLLQCGVFRLWRNDHPAQFVVWRATRDRCEGGWLPGALGSAITFVGQRRRHVLICLTQGGGGHCLLRICQETHHIVAAGCRYIQRGIFSPREIPDGEGSSGPVRPQSWHVAAGGYRMAYRVSSCRRDVPPGVALRGADVVAPALQHLFPLSCRGLSSSSRRRSSRRCAFGDGWRVVGCGRGLVDT